MKRHVARLLVLLALCGACLNGCERGALLTDVSIRPTVISPNADGTDDIAEIKYTLTRQSNITVYLLDAAGNRHYYRQDQRRSRGPRTAYFSGVVADSLLPDGEYTCVFEATDERGRTETQRLPITLVDGDKEPLEILNLSVWPNAFTPNRDGITDRVNVTYALSKEVSQVWVKVVAQDGTEYPVAEDNIREMGAEGPHEHDYDAGIDLGAAPPPDGEYTVVVEAQDAVGNRRRVEAPLTIAQGGVPRVVIVNAAADWSPLVVPLGDTLTFTCTVKNTGLVPVRTKGPQSGSSYTTSENYNTVEQYEEPGIFRVGLDYEGNSAGRQYPFRWQLGTDEELTVIETSVGPQRYLMPGQTVTVVGHLRITDAPNMVAPYYWIGLIQEQVQIVQDRVEATQVSVGF